MVCVHKANVFVYCISFVCVVTLQRKAGNSLSRPAGRFCIGRSSWDVVGQRPGIGYVSSKYRGIGRASCVEQMPARRRPAVSNMFDIAGRPTPGRPADLFWLFATKAALAAIKIGMNSSSESAMMNFGMYITWASILNLSLCTKHLNLN